MALRQWSVWKRRGKSSAEYWCTFDRETSVEGTDMASGEKERDIWCVEYFWTPGYTVLLSFIVKSKVFVTLTSS
jgi:hypothetical protein